MKMDWSEIDVKLTDSNWYAQNTYHDVYKTLRDEDPVHFSNDHFYGRDYWYITTYDSVKEVLERTGDFSNRLPGGRIPRSPVRIPPEQRYAMGFDVQINAQDGAL